jgi:hypothetical protein
MPASASSPKHVILSLSKIFHAGEQRNNILARKQQDIARIGRTYWFVRAANIDPAQVIRLVPLEVLFITPRRGQTQNEAEEDAQAVHCVAWSLDRVNWKTFRQTFPGLSPVAAAGKVDGGCRAMVLDELSPDPGKPPVDLTEYCRLDGSAIRFTPWDSTVIASRQESPRVPARASCKRHLVARGLLCGEGFVYVR